LRTCAWRVRTGERARTETELGCSPVCFHRQPRGGGWWEVGAGIWQYPIATKQAEVVRRLLQARLSRRAGGHPRFLFWSSKSSEQGGARGWRHGGPLGAGRSGERDARFSNTPSAPSSQRLFAETWLRSIAPSHPLGTALHFFRAAGCCTAAASSSRPPLKPWPSACTHFWLARGAESTTGGIISYQVNALRLLRQSR
jgi:hypothetical protein